MSGLPWLLLGAAFSLMACTRADPEPARTPLPTRQTTIDPVNSKLDAAAQDTERRRQDVDHAAR